VHATHGNGLADYEAIAGSRDYGKKREAGPIRGGFLCNMYARRRVFLQHRIRYDDSDGVDRQQPKRLDAPITLCLLQQINRYQIQPGK